MQVVSLAFEKWCRLRRGKYWALYKVMSVGSTIDYTQTFKNCCRGHTFLQHYVACNIIVHVQ